MYNNHEKRALGNMQLYGMLTGKLTWLTQDQDSQ